MSRLPSVSFIEGDPPVSNRRDAKLMVGWVGYVIARLEARPGVWAEVDAENANTSNIKVTARAVGVDVDARIVNHVLYMRLNQ